MGRRLRNIQISDVMMVAILNCEAMEGAEVDEGRLPADCKVVHAQMGDFGRTIVLTVESAEFEELGEGEVPPAHSITYRRCR